MLDALRRNVMWRAIPFAGLAAGTVHLLTNVVLMPLIYDIDPTLLIRYWASLVLGSQILTDHQTLYLIIGILVHYALSILFTLVIAIVVHRWGLLIGIVGGAILGVAIYLINLYALTAIFQWFYAVNNTALLVSHILFGAVAGGVYEVLDRYDEPLIQERSA